MHELEKKKRNAWFPAIIVARFWPYIDQRRELTGCFPHEPARLPTDDVGDTERSDVSRELRYDSVDSYPAELVSCVVDDDSADTPHSALKALLPDNDRGESVGVHTLSMGVRDVEGSVDWLPSWGLTAIDCRPMGRMRSAGMMCSRASGNVCLNAKSSFSAPSTSACFLEGPTPTAKLGSRLQASTLTTHLYSCPGGRLRSREQSL
mmetsp:Transcript_67633/g.119984  ORF Transcript_67633/g.119984 Transcript_67633/m.119984 type:complete len:206 (+) Transcript_67633:567-1184(+)